MLPGYRKILYRLYLIDCHQHEVFYPILDNRATYGLQLPELLCFRSFYQADFLLQFFPENYRGLRYSVFPIPFHCLVYHLYKQYSLTFFLRTNVQHLTSDLYILLLHW